MTISHEAAVQQGVQYLEQGRALLLQGQAAAATEPLTLARQTPAAPEVILQAHALIEQHGLPGCFSNIMGLECAISAEDDIFRFFAGHPSSLNPVRDYLADGWRTLAELMVLLERCQQPLCAMPRVLDFASGHGRFTRHLVKALSPQQVTVADVVPSAVEFSRQAFGVQGFLSASVPEQVRWPQQYELVFVLSLFSHLPRATWLRWLAVLQEAVAPGGLLVFSTHGQKAADFHHVPLDAEGFFFTPSSESLAIDGQEYGTTFTTPAFVQQAIAQTWGEQALVQQSAPAQ